MSELSKAIKAVEKLKAAGGDVYPLGVLWGSLLGWVMPAATGRELKLVRKLNSLLSVRLGVAK